MNLSVVCTLGRMQDNGMHVSAISHNFGSPSISHLCETVSGGRVYVSRLLIDDI